jgi:hypothetical protein
LTVIETATHPSRSRRFDGTLMLACISLVLSLTSFTGLGLLLVTNEWNPLPVQSKPQSASAGQVEAVAHVTLPPGTILLFAAYSNGLETHLSAKLRFPRAQLDAFIAAAGLTAAPTPGLRAVTAADNVGGGNLWDPDAATTIAGVEEQQPTADGTYRRLLLDLGVPDMVTTYLYAARG